MKTPNPIAFTIAGIDIRWYGILIGTGFLLAILLSYKKAPRFGIKKDHILDLAIFMIPISVVGARAYYVLFSWDYYAGDLSKILNIRGGGLAIHGGLIAGALTAFFLCKHHKINFFNLADLIFPNVALAQSIGRWGNYFNSEAHGGPTNLPWGIWVEGQKVHPTFLYESIWCLMLFILLTHISNKRKFTGQVFCLYGILYSIERIFVEQLRTDSLMIGIFKQAQIFSFAVIAACILLYFYLKNKKQKGDSNI